MDLLCKYYNLLYYAERRFFPVERNIGIYFEWYDSLTGNTNIVLYINKTLNKLSSLHVLCVNGNNYAIRVFTLLTGEPSCQKTIALEKASILFNIAALYTQIGAKKDRTQLNELNDAVDCFLKAAGIFQHIIG